MTLITATCTATPCLPVTKPLSVYATLARVHNVWRQRRSLKALDAAALSDIGVTRAEARAEAGRLIWDAPQNWRN